VGWIAFNALFGTVPLLLDEASVQIAERMQIVERRPENTGQVLG